MEKKGIRLNGIFGGVLVLCLGFSVACDRDKGEINPAQEVVSAIKDDAHGEYEADLQPVNNSGVTGTATVAFIEGEEFGVSVDAIGLTPSMSHPQHIHQNNQCAPPEAAGADGLLTMEEALPYIGPVFIPLDFSLAPLSEDEFPIADENGKVEYDDAIDLDVFLPALDQHHEGVQTLSTLNLENRIIEIHGAYVLNGAIVPAGTPDAIYDPTIPVACGLLRVAD